MLLLYIIRRLEHNVAAIITLKSGHTVEMSFAAQNNFFFNFGGNKLNFMICITIMTSIF